MLVRVTSKETPGRQGDVTWVECISRVGMNHSRKPLAIARETLRQRRDTTQRGRCRIFLCTMNWVRAR